MTNPLAVITGATSGIGEAGAIELAKQGYDLFLTARNEAKAKKTQARILKAKPEATVHWGFGDFASLSDMNKIAKAFLNLDKTVSLLWLNAGVCANKRILTSDGYELMWAVNHLAPFLLTQKIWPNLIGGHDPLRVVVTASGAYRAVNGLDLDNVNWEQNFKIFSAYGHSKLANILFTQELSRRLAEAAPSKTFTVNCFHPGFVGTGIGTQVWYGRLIMALCKPFVRSPLKGAETGLYLATEQNLTGRCGNYYYDCSVHKLPQYATNRTSAEQLWDASLNMVDGH